MSYALLKSYLFCKLKPTDPRVQAVIEWLSKNYRLDYNPGMEGASDKPEREVCRPLLLLPVDGADARRRRSSSC